VTRRHREEIALIEMSLTGVTDDELAEELTKVAQRFKGKRKKVRMDHVCQLIGKHPQ
jgi:hypothetical protein